MLKKKGLLGFVLVMMMSMVMAACGNSGSKPTTGESTAPDTKATAQPAKKWVHGVTKQKGDAAFQERMAMEKGYFAQKGIDFQIMEFEGDAIILKALIAGEVDSMEVNPSNSLVAISQGSDLKFVGGSIPGLSHVLYTKKNIKSIEDIKGKNVGISAPGALPQVLMQALFYEKKLDIEAATWVNAGSDAERVKALIAGKIDAAISAVDYKTEVDKPANSVNAHYIADIGEILPNYLRYVFVVTGNTTKNRGDDLTKVLQAAAEGQRYCIEHRDEALNLAAKILQTTPSDPTLALVYDVHVDKKLIAPNLTMDPNSIKWMYDLNKKLGKITTDFDVDKTIDLSFAKKAIANIGEYKWPSK